MNIKVLWIDDEFEKQQDVIGDAEQDGIDLIPYEDHLEGIEALLSDIKGFHAVILDAKVKFHKDDTVSDLKGLRASRDKLLELHTQGHYIPFFIFTGQPDYMDNEMFIQTYGEYFIKGKDNQKLFNCIKDKVLNKDEYMVQSEYKRIFDLCDKYFDQEVRKHLTEILCNIKKPNVSFNDELYFTPIRKILEYIFRILNKKGLLHDLCIPNGKLNLTESNLFLSGEPTKYLGVKCSVSHFPKLISDATKSIIHITGAGGHTVGDEIKDNIDLKEYRSIVKTSYLLYSLVFKLFDIIIWLDEYLQSNDNFETNKSFWIDDITSELIQGIITKIENGYGTFLPNNSRRTISIIPKMVNENYLFVGQELKVKTKIEGDKTKITQIEI